MKIMRKISFVVTLILVISFFSGQVFVAATTSRYDILDMDISQESYAEKFNEINAEKSITRSENPESYRYYTWGIVDGGIYYIKNKSTGKYWTSPSATNGNISLTNFSGSNMQEFKVRYLGQDEYGFEPIQLSSDRVRVTSTSSSLTSSAISYSSSYHRFKITALNDTDYRISTKQSSFSYNLIASSSIVSQSTSTGNTAIWQFEKKDDRVHDSAKAYYLKDTNTGLYLTSVSSSSSTLIFKEFRGDETQRFKRVVSYTENGAEYTYAPLINPDRRVNSYSSNLYAYYLNQYIDYQKFAEIYQGDFNYKISSYSDSQYIKIGSSYGTNEFYASKGTASTSCDFNIIEAKFITPFIYWKPFDTNNYYQVSTNYTQKIVLCFEAPYTGKYTYGMRRDVGTPIVGIFDKDGYYVYDSVTTNGTNGQTVEANLIQGRIYYINIIGVNNSDVFQVTNNLLKNLTFYLHGMNTYINDGNDSNADRRTKFAIPGKVKLDAAFLCEGVINTNANMTDTFVTNIDVSTGYVPLRAPVYMFRGHGSPTTAQYCTGTNSSAGTVTRIRNTTFVNTSGATVFDMSDSRFVAWIGCDTAGAVTTGNNLTRSTRLAGATTVLGFSDSISRGPATNFSLRLIDNLIDGQTINTAVNNAKSGIQFWFSGLGSFVIEGDANQRLKLNLGSGYVTRTAQVFARPNFSDYVLESVASNGLKRYVKYINGYPTNDYYDILFDEAGNVTYRYDSQSKIDRNSISSAKSVISAFSSSYSILPSKVYIEDNMIFTSINKSNTYDYIVYYEDNYIPVRFVVTEYSNNQGFKTLDIKAINMVTKRILPEDILWEKN